MNGIDFQKNKKFRVKLGRVLIWDDFGGNEFVVQPEVVSPHPR